MLCLLGLSSCKTDGGSLAWGFSVLIIEATSAFVSVGGRVVHKAVNACLLDCCSY